MTWSILKLVILDLGRADEVHSLEDGTEEMVGSKGQERNVLIKGITIAI